MELFYNTHVLNNLQKRLKTRISATKGRLADKDASFESRFVIFFLLYALTICADLPSPRA